jgi:hypothetical protein
MAYKEKLLECRELRGQAGSSAHRRAVLLTEVYDDPEFRDTNGGLDDFGLADLLSEFIEDLCLNFFQIKRMLEEFPRRSDWAQGKLYSMWETVVEKDNKKRASVKVENRVSYKQLYTDLLHENTRLKEENQSMRAELRRLQRTARK